MNLLMFGGPSAWDGAWYSRHHLTAGLASRHQVFMAGEPTDWHTLFSDPLRLLRPGRTSKDAQGTIRYEPPGWLPAVYRWNGIRSALESLRCRSLKRTLRAEGADGATCYVWHPNHRDAVAGFVGNPLVYHCYDRYDRYTGAGANVREQERWLVQRSTICVAASFELGEHLSSLGAREVAVVRHGVDHRLFRPGWAIHPDLDRISGPRLGIVASLTDAVDVDTLLHVARERPDWSLVIVGGVFFSNAEKRSRFDTLCGLSNVHHVGFRPRTEMPAWIGGFDVALASYDLNTWAPYIQPLKMYEYLACGVSVVASDIAATRELGDLVERALSPGEWIPAIERALRQDHAAHVPDRLAFAQANSWERRTADLETILRRVSGDDTPSPDQLLTTAISSRTATR
jgi:glycosyltransferase involved in cell wall biosynthesis